MGKNKGWLTGKNKRIEQYARKEKRSHLPIFALLAWLSGCALLQSAISYYDPTTYKNLTDLKPEVAMLYETFTSDPVDSISVRSIRLKFAQMYEYEKGKGENNAETTEQINIIRKMFDRHVEERRRGVWTGEHMLNQVENIGDAFDIAISTERLKNKNK